MEDKFTDVYRTGFHLHAVKLWETPSSYALHEIVAKDTDEVVARFVKEVNGDVNICFLTPIQLQLETFLRIVLMIY